MPDQHLAESLRETAYWYMVRLLANNSPTIGQGSRGGNNENYKGVVVQSVIVSMAWTGNLEESHCAPSLAGGRQQGQEEQPPHASDPRRRVAPTTPCKSTSGASLDELA